MGKIEEGMGGGGVPIPKSSPSIMIGERSKGVRFDFRT